MNKQKKVFISGVSGMDGSNMADYLIKNTNYDIIGGIRRTVSCDYRNIKHLLNNDRFSIVHFDLADPFVIESIVKNIKPDYFINFAANSFVGDSWQIPVLHFDYNAKAVIYMLEAIKNFSPETRYYQAGCHDIETHVVTKDGIKHYKDVKVGDLVYSINESTSALEFKRVLKTFEYDYDGELYEFKKGGLRITPNHTVLYKTVRGNILKKEANEFIKLSDVKYPINKPLVGKKLPKYFDLSDRIPLQKKDGNKTYGKHIKKIDSYDLCYLIGLYLGDGSCRVLERKHKISGKAKPKRGGDGRFVEMEKKHETTYRNPQIVIDIPPSDCAFSKLTEVLDRNHIKWSLYGRCDVTFCQWGLIDLFEECGKSAREKKIPDWILELDSSYQLKVLEGIIDSDGDDRGVISTVSTKLIDSISRLMVNCGRIPRFSSRKELRKATLKDGRVISGNFLENSIRARVRNTGYQKGNFTRTPYKGKVWCLEVEDNHNFLVERNGKFTFSGNSSEQFGDILYSPQDEEHPFRPRSPYGLSKCSAHLAVKVYRESYNLYAVSGILFNHEGTRRGEEFITRKISKGVARICREIFEGKEIKPLELGNLDAKRDWSDSVDFVDGIWRMLNQDVYCENYSKPKDYVLSSGETHTVREFVEKSFSYAGIIGTWIGQGQDEMYCLVDIDKFKSEGINDQLRGVKIPLVKINPKFYRPAEVDLLWGNSEKAREELGWKPEFDFDQLVKKMTIFDLENH